MMKNASQDNWLPKLRFSRSEKSAKRGKPAFARYACDKDDGHGSPPCPYTAHASLRKDGQW